MSITLNDRESILKRLYNNNSNVWIEAQADAIELIEKQGDELDKLNAVMPCGHVARYQFEEEGTQYCYVCENKGLMEYLQTVGDVLKGINEIRDMERDAK